MIRKPIAAERESRAHATVGRAIESGGEVRIHAASAAGTFGAVYLLGFLGMMALGLLMSSTPLWFKAIGIAGFYGLYRLFRSFRRKQLAVIRDRHAARDRASR